MSPKKFKKDSVQTLSLIRLVLSCQFRCGHLSSYRPLWRRNSVDRGGDDHTNNNNSKQDECLSRAS
jgi:hypothetical protein